VVKLTTVQVISFKLHVAQIDLFRLLVFFSTLLPTHDQRIKKPIWLSKRLCAAAVTIFPWVRSCCQNDNHSSQQLMPLLQVRTLKCHATNRHCAVRFVDSSIRIRASFPTIRSSYGNKPIATPRTNINVKWDKCFIKKHNWYSLQLISSLKRWKVVGVLRIRFKLIPLTHTTAGLCNAQSNVF
jgi:hypothetical protein